MEVVLNRYKEDFNCDFTIAFNVKYPNVNCDIYQHEFETGAFTNMYAQNCFVDICLLKTKFTVVDWAFSGRSNGWWVLICKGPKPEVTSKIIERIEKCVKKYFDDYEKNMLKFYKHQ